MSRPVIRKSERKIITLNFKTLGERVLVNNLLEYFHNAKIISNEFDCFKAKVIKFFTFTNLS